MVKALRWCTILFKFVLIASFILVGCPTLYIKGTGITLDSFTVGLVFIGLFAMAHIADYLDFRNTQWAGSASGIIIMVVFGTLLFAANHFYWTVALLAAVVVSFFAFLIFFGRRYRFFKSLNASRLACAFLSLVLFFVPATLGYLQDSEAYPTDKKWQEISQCYDDDELIHKLSNWDSLNQEERMECLYRFTAAELSYLGVDNIKTVKIIPLDDGLYGVFKDSDMTISLNLSCIGKRTLLENLNTVCHEAFHAYQYKVVSTFDFENQVAEGEYYYKNAREWKENWNNYVSAKDDYEKYRSQPVERDAVKYAEERCLYYEGILKKR